MLLIEKEEKLNKAHNDFLEKNAFSIQEVGELPKCTIVGQALGIKFKYCLN